PNRSAHRPDRRPRCFGFALPSPALEIQAPRHDSRRRFDGPTAAAGPRYTRRPDLSWWDREGSGVDASVDLAAIERRAGSLAAGAAPIVGADPRDRAVSAPSDGLQPAFGGLLGRCQGVCSTERGAAPPRREKGHLVLNHGADD